MDRRADQTMSAPGCSTEQDQLCATSAGQKPGIVPVWGRFAIDRAPPDWASAECRRDHGNRTAFPTRRGDAQSISRSRRES